MFGSLASFTNLLRSIKKDKAVKKSILRRNNNVMAMLESYFLLKDLADDGAALVKEAGPSPIQTINSLPDIEAKTLLAKWDKTLRFQANRMRRLSQLVFGQDFLDIITPELRTKLNQVVGSKFQRNNSLQSIGAALFFRDTFSSEKSNEDFARYIGVMVGQNENFLDLEEIQSEIRLLRLSLMKYREVIEQMVTGHELMELSKKARQKTELS